MTLSTWLHQAVLRCVIASACLLSGCLLGSAFAFAGKPKVQPVPLVSPNDDRQYRSLILDNGLRVLIVSDPEQDVAAASMSVSVGSFDDPPSRPGLAHFLEHMLFLGTKRYPEPDGYSNFMSKHSGRHNAYTANDHTNYFLQIKPDEFGEALARFGQFFISPLFNATYVDKERNAVHNEYQLHLKDDRWRIHSAQRVAFNPEHPASRGYIGSLETLSDEQGPVLNDLLDFYARHYKASRMVLVLSAPHSLNRQQSWVRRHFSKIPGGNTDSGRVPVPMFTPDQLPALLDIRPEAELRILNFSFSLPSTRRHYRTKPIQYIASLIGHEGEGSLYAYLKKRGWMESIVTQSGNIWLQDANLDINIGLTPAGVENWQAVGDAVFSYIRLLKEADSSAQWRFDEESLLSDLAFRYKPRSQPVNYVSELSVNSFYYPPLDVIRGPFLIDAYKPELVTEYLRLLTPDRVLVTRVAPEIETDSVETWFNVNYKHQPLDANVQNRWASVGVMTGMRLPEKNEFLPKNLALISETAETSGTNTTPSNTPSTTKPVATTSIAPRRLDVPRASVWHSPDTSFNIPEARLVFRLRNPNFVELTAAQQAMLELYLGLVDDSLRIFSYPARLAGLGYSVGSLSDSAIISISGYNDSQSLLLDKVMQAFTGLEIVPERFAILKDSLIRAWRNTRKAEPRAIASLSLGNILQTQSFRPELLIDALNPITPEQLADFAASWISDLGINSLMIGNVTEAQAISLANIVINAVPNATADAAPNNDQLVSLATGGAVRQEQVDHNDALLLVYVQGQGQSFTERAHYAVLARILHPAYFNDLRTEKQLGYITAAYSRALVGVPGIFFLTQSPNADVATLYQVTNDFLQNFSEQLDELYVRNLRDYKQSVIARLRERDKNLGNRLGRYLLELSAGKTNFDTRTRLAEAVDKITKTSLIAAFNNFRSRFAHNSLIVYSKGKFEAELNLPNLTLLTDEEFDSLHAREDAFRYEPTH